MTKQILSRTDVRAVRCPECGAGSGQRCIGARGKPRQANHQSRVNAAQRVAELPGGRELIGPWIPGRPR